MSCQRTGPCGAACEDFSWCADHALHGLLSQDDPSMANVSCFMFGGRTCRLTTAVRSTTHGRMGPRLSITERGQTHDLSTHLKEQFAFKGPSHGHAPIGFAFWTHRPATVRMVITVPLPMERQ